MCGIAGILHLDKSKNHFDKKTYRQVQEMIKLIKYRGPDAQKVVVCPSGAMGFSHLSFIGKLSNQPIFSEDGRYLFVCNGEIFNHLSLRKDLENLGHVFSSDSDCECILHLFEQYGSRGFSKLNGQFAAVIWDKYAQKCILLRDPFGICPLFYTVKNTQLFFSSEIKAILQVFPNNVSVDMRSLVQTILFYGPIPPHTIFHDINQVEPGETVEISNTGVNRCFYINIYSNTKILKGSKSEKSHILEKYVNDAVKLRLQEKYNSAVCISGGLDSSWIASIATTLNPKVMAYSIQFTDYQYDESPYQKQLVNFLGITHIPIMVSLNNIIDNLIQTIWHAELPLTRTAPIPVYMLSKAIYNENNQYILSGEGADELFAGYPVFQRCKTSIQDKFDKGICILKNLGLFNQMEDIIKADYTSFIPNNRASNLKNLQKIEINTKLSQYLLSTQGDRMYMSHSIEPRFPYLDSNVVSFAFSLQKSDVLFQKQNKYLMRLASCNKIPESIRLRNKQGYLAPTIHRQMMKNDLGKELLSKYFSSQYTRQLGYFSDYYIKEISHKMDNDSLDETDKTCFLIILTTHILHSLFIEKSTF